MQGFSEKLTAYDFLVMLIPGIVVVYCICCWLHCSSVLFETEIAFYCVCDVAMCNSQTLIGQVCIAVVLLSLSYITGLTVNCISDTIFGKFRNNETHLRLAVLQYHVQQCGTGINYKKSIKKKDLKNSVKKRYRLFRQIFGRRNRFYCTPEKIYYQKYYWLIDNKRLCAAIPVLEAQVAFVRNMILPTLVLAIFTFTMKELVPGVLLMFLCLVELWLMFLRQMRIYHIVIEDYHRYKNEDNEV